MEVRSHSALNNISRPDGIKVFQKSPHDAAAATMGEKKGGGSFAELKHRTCQIHLAENVFL